MKEPVYAIKTGDEYVYFHAGYRELRTDAKVPKRSGQSTVLEVARELVQKAYKWNDEAIAEQQSELDRANNGGLAHLDDERIKFYTDRYKTQIKKYQDRTFYIVKMSEEVVE